MNFGDNWKEFLGECTKETAFEMLDFFYDNGGNFIDTGTFRARMLRTGQNS